MEYALRQSYVTNVFSVVALTYIGLYQIDYPVYDRLFVAGSSQSVEVCSREHKPKATVKSFKMTPLD